MSYATDPMGYALDMYITGHYGMDQYGDEDIVECICDNCPIQVDPEDCVYDPINNYDVVFHCPILKYLLDEDYKQECRWEDVMYRHFVEEEHPGMIVDNVTGEMIYEQH